MKRKVGFIVEGHGEYASYPSLYCRITGDHGPPIQNAGSYSNIVMRLAAELHDLIKVHEIKTVIVTVDLDDCIKDGHGKNEAEIREKLESQITEFKLAAKSDDRIKHKLPSAISVVFQIRKFESWLISDVKGLIEKGLVAKTVEPLSNVDQIRNPSKWLKDNYIGAKSSKMKSPQVAKRIVSASDPSRMKLASNSFNEFYEAILHANK